MQSHKPSTRCDYGQRLLPSLIDEYSKSQPERTFVAIPRSADLSEGWQDISYAVYAKAINRCSWWIEENLGRGLEFETISYMGPLDIRYLIILMAAAKTGYTAYFSSDRNSLGAHFSLLQSTNCNIIVVADGAPSICKQIVAQRQMRVKQMPDSDFFLSSDEHVESYRFDKTFQEARLDPLIIMHTSGSTGFPKPVFVKHGTWAAMDAYQLIPPSDEGPLHSDFLRGKRVFLNLPMFHGACECFIYGMGVYGGAIPLLPPPGPRSAEISDLAHRFGNVFGSIAPPSILKDLYETPKYFDNIEEKINFLGFAGGSLSKEIGDKISKTIKVIGFFGSTETAYLPCKISSIGDWIYYNYSSYLGHEFRRRTDGKHEMVLVRNKNLDLFQSIFSTFSHLNEYLTSDLYEQHPSKPGYWMHCGRADDIIAFSSGEKTNPISFEQTVAAHPAVRAAFVGGNNEFQASLLVEPKTHPRSDDEHTKFINEIWPAVEDGNRDCPAHARILRNFVIVTKPDKPLTRAGKDTIQRASISQLYAKEFEELYAKNAKATSSPATHKHITKSNDAEPQEELRDVLYGLICDNSWIRGDLDCDVPLFEIGLDSLQLPGLVENINEYLSISRPDLEKITTRTLYAHPSIGKLAQSMKDSKDAMGDLKAKVLQARDTKV